MKSGNVFAPSREGPLHLVLFPDGGRRWAKKSGTSLEAAYRKSAEIIADFVCLASRNGISRISVSASSIENYLRDEEEVSAIHNSISFFRARYEPALLTISGMSLRYIHGLDVTDVRTNDKCESSPLCNVNIYTKYDASQEIANAIRLLENVQSDHLVSDFASHLIETTPVNVTFRSGGFSTLGNFLPLMLGYARHYCDERLFNDIAPEEILRIVNEVMRKKVYFGGSSIVYGSIEY